MVTWDINELHKYERRLAKNRNKGLPQSAVAKPVVQVEPLAAEERKTHDPDRFRVCITSVRVRPIDPDNAVGKFFTDCLRYCGIIPEDTPEVIDYTIKQRKTAEGEEPHTLITVERI